MHTMAKVKNAALADGDAPEPLARVIGEEQVVAAADRLIANTDDEAQQLVDLYDADPARVVVVHPGVDLDLFRAAAAAAARAPARPARRRARAAVRRPDPAAEGARRAAARGRRAARRATRRCARRLVVAVVGGPSGTGLEHPESLAELAAELGIADVVRFVPPVAAGRAAPTGTAPPTLVVVPSYNESFGLVALEAQACGTPVVAAAVGGLRTAVRDGVSGLLVDGPRPGRLRRARSSGLLDDARPARRLGRGARWRTPRSSAGSAPPTRMLDVYARARASMRDDLPGCASRDPATRRPSGDRRVRARSAAADLEYEEPPTGVFVVALPGRDAS